MAQYRMIGTLVFENGQIRRIDGDIVDADDNQTPQEVIKMYLVRWAMVMGSTLDDYTMTTARLK